MATNQALLDTIATLVEETGHSAEDVVETLVVLAGCAIAACSLPEYTVINEAGTISYTITEHKIKK